jgi:proteasome accessory factor C
VLGVGPDEAIDVYLGDAEATMLDQLREAASGRNEVEIIYYSFGRDDRTVRTIVPWRVFADAGSWYVHAWCQLAEGERLFRLDRIEKLSVVGPADPERAGATEPGTGPVAVFQPRSDDPRVTLRLAPEASWVAETYPAVVVETGEDGGLVVELVVSAVPWLERLLVQLGGAAEVVAAEGIDDAGQLGSRAASRMLARYRHGTGG